MLDKRKNAFFPKNRRAQIAETMTWVVATIIIVVALLGFVYTASLLAKTKVPTFKDLKIEIEKEEDWISKKTDFAFSLNDENREMIEQWIKEDKNDK